MICKLRTFAHKHVENNDTAVNGTRALILLAFFLCHLQRDFIKTVMRIVGI